MLNTLQEEKTLKISDIISYYKNGVKSKTSFQMGVEWEKQSLDKKTLQNASYDTLKEVIEEYAHIKNWGILKENGVTIGAYDGKNSISLEPGGQLELSLEPKKSIEEVEKSSNEIWKVLDKIGKFHDVIFVPLGLTPISTYKNIDIVPKERYLIMRDYFEQKCEKLPRVMMRETASIQINVDYSSEEDAMNKLRAMAYVLPFITGFFGNSYIRENKLNGYKSYRANAWLDTDKDRCGFFYTNIFKKASPSFEDYVESIIKTPVLFIERNNKKVLIRGKINFQTFMEKGFEGHFPNINDYILHSSLTFPSIRLKNYIEIRNLDSQKRDMMLAICALFKGLLSKRETVERILEEFRVSFEELEDLSINCAKFGLSFKHNKVSAYEIAEKIFKLSFEHLERQEDKVKLLKCLEMLSHKTSVSDMMLGKNIKDSKKLVEFSLS